MAELPMIVLAFANDQVGHRYLRKLPLELQELQEVLETAEANGLCRLKVLPNASLRQIFDVFTAHRDQITILHYAGHAGDNQLFFEPDVAGGSHAPASGLATFLGQRKGLQLVFLNGCSTRAQTAGLLDAGVASVISTGRSIDDTVAREFAVGFYTELASGAPLRAAYEAARGRIMAAHGDSPKAYFRGEQTRDAIVESDSPDPADDQGFPWEFRPGTELVERWSLPDAAGNPEFGLPLPPERDLPESPFRHLAWFTAEHAEVFFGRGYQVREMYEQVTDPTGPPILLLYGASGVGKSSLLDAGLVPRLEAAAYAVRYRRRDQAKGLTGTLRDALGLADDTPLAEGWRAEEAKLDRPLIVFLDQVEEVFTRPDKDRPRELDDFVAALMECLGNRESRPRGRFVCGFRKEWLAEIDRRLAEAKLPRARVFLKPLDRRGIIEAIGGPARPGRLQRHFRFSIEAGLPEAIAEDLLADAGSALAPTLQILLTKMWERARQADPEATRFDRVLYETLKASGYLLKDVLDEALKAIAAWCPPMAESGLPLDLLVFHTTDLGTASQRTRAELDARYSHQDDTLDDLLGHCKDRYLMIEAETSPGSPDRSTRLAHDLLAPLVQLRFRVSMAPGQLARRLLENRAPEWRDGRTGAVLDRTDLQSVEAGASGMRAWTADEARLVKESRRAEEAKLSADREQTRRIQTAEYNQRKAEVERQRATEQRLKEQQESNRRLRRRAVAIGVTLAATLVVTLLAAYEWRAALKAKNVAEIQTSIAKRQASVAESRRLASLSQLAVADRLDVATLLALEASTVATTQESITSLQSALDARPEVSGFRDVPEGCVRSVAFGPKGEIAAGYGGVRDSDPGGVVVFDASGARLRPQPLEVKEGGVRKVAFGPKGEIAAGYSGSGPVGGVVVFDMSGARLRHLVVDGGVGSVAFGPKGEIAAGYYDHRNGRGGGVVVFDASGVRLRPDPLLVKEGGVGSVAFGPKGEIAAGYSGSGPVGGVVVFDASGARLRPQPLEVKEGGVTSVDFGPKGEIAAGYYSDRGGVVVFDASGARLRPQPLEVREGIVYSVDFGQGGEIATGYISGSRGGVVVFDASGARLRPQPLEVREGMVFSVAFGPKGEIAAGYSISRDNGSGGVVVFGATGSRLRPAPLEVKEGNVISVASGPKGEIAAGYASNDGGGVVVFDVSGARLRPQPLEVGEGRISIVTFGPKGEIAVGGSGEGGGRGGVVVFDASGARLRPQPLEVKEGGVTSVDFGPKGEIAAGYASNDGGGVVVFDASGARLRPQPLEVKEGNVTSVAFGPKGEIAAGYAGSGTVGGVVVFNDSGARLRPEPLVVKEGGVRSVAFGPKGEIAAGYGGGNDCAVVLFDKSGSRLYLAPLVIHGGYVYSMALGPKGEIAAGYEEGNLGGVVIFDWSGSRLLPSPLVVQEGGVRCVAFGPKAEIIAGYSAGKVGGVVVFDVDPTSWRKKLERTANRNFTWREWRIYFPDPESTYRRTVRSFPWPRDLQGKAKDDALRYEEQHPENVERL